MCARSPSVIVHPLGLQMGRPPRPGREASVGRPPRRAPPPLGVGMQPRGLPGHRSRQRPQPTVTCGATQSRRPRDVVCSLCFVGGGGREARNDDVTRRHPHDRKSLGAEAQTWPTRQPPSWRIAGEAYPPESTALNATRCTRAMAWHRQAQRWSVTRAGRGVGPGRTGGSRAWRQDGSRGLRPSSPRGGSSTAVGGADAADAHTPGWPPSAARRPGHRRRCLASCRGWLQVPHQACLQLCALMPGVRGTVRASILAGIQARPEGSIARAHLRSTSVAAAMAGLRAAGCTAPGRLLPHPVSTSWVTSIWVRCMGDKGRHAWLGVMPLRLPCREVTLTDPPIE